MAAVTVHDISRSDSDINKVPLDNEWDISPTRNTATKQKPGPSKPTTRLSARGRSQSHEILALAATSERPARSMRPRDNNTTSTSPSNDEVFPASRPSPTKSVASESRKRKPRPSEILINTTPAKRQKKQEWSQFDNLVGAMDKATTPRKSAHKEPPIGLTPSQSPSRQDEWNLRMLQDAKVFVKLLRTNGSPAASDAPFTETYWWPARVSIIS